MLCRLERPEPTSAKPRSARALATLRSRKTSTNESPGQYNHWLPALLADVTSRRHLRFVCQTGLMDKSNNQWTEALNNVKYIQGGQKRDIFCVGLSYMLFCGRFFLYFILCDFQELQIVLHCRLSCVAPSVQIIDEHLRGRSNGLRHWRYRMR